MNIIIRNQCCVYVSMTSFYPPMLLLRFNYIDTTIIHAFSCYILIYSVCIEHSIVIHCGVGEHLDCSQFGLEYSSLIVWVKLYVASGVWSNNYFFGCTHWSELVDRVVCACSAFHDRTKPPSKVDVRVYIVHSPWQLVWILVLQTNKRDGCKMKFTVVLIVLFMIFTEFEPLFIYLEASFFYFICSDLSYFISFFFF